MQLSSRHPNSVSTIHVRGRLPPATGWLLVEARARPHSYPMPDIVTIAAPTSRYSLCLEQCEVLLQQLEVSPRHLIH